jgi:hypothetical protein
LQRFARLSPPRLRFGIIIAAAFVAISWAARFDSELGRKTRSLVYPFDTFSMYAIGQHTASHIVVLYEGGVVRGVESYERFDCPTGFELERAVCDAPVGTYSRVAYLERKALLHIREHGGAGEREVRVVRRVWSVPEDGPPVRLADCELATCRVSP